MSDLPGSWRVGRIALGLGAWARSGGSAVVIAHVVALRSAAQAINIATGLVTAAMLGAGGRGELAALTTAPGFLAGLASLGLHASLIYHVKASPAQARAFLGNALLLTFSAGMIAAAAGWALLPGWLAQYPPDAVAAGRWLVLSTPFTVATWTMMGAAEARGWFAFANRTLYLQSGLVLLLLGLLWALHRLTPVAAAFAYLAPTVPVFAYFAFHTWRRASPDFLPRPRLMARLIHYGLRLCGVDLVSTMAGYADQLLVIAVLPPATVGAYVVALSAARLLNVIQSGTIAVLFPNIAARPAGSVFTEVAACFRLVMLVTGVAAAVLALVGPPLLLLIYGVGFAGALAPFRLLLVAALLGNGAGVLSQAYAACGRPGLVTGGEALGLLVTVLLMLALVPSFGTMGAASAVTVAAGLRVVVFGRGLRLFLHADAGSLLPRAADLVRLRRMFAFASALPQAPATGSPGLEQVP